MTQEDKDLLLKDLCARLPYGVICNDSRHGGSRITEIDVADKTVYCYDFDEYAELDKIKPYLRPMSSMTKAEVLEYISLKESIIAIDDMTYFFETYESIDWLNSHHLDYRGLIEKGIALVAPKGMY